MLSPIALVRGNPARAKFAAENIMIADALALSCYQQCGIEYAVYMVYVKSLI